MMQKNKIRNFNIKCCFVIFTIAILGQSCVSFVKHENMKLKTELDNPSILKLRNYGETNASLLAQSEDIANGHLFKKDGDEWGYYVLSYKTKQEKLGLGVLAGAFFYLIPLGLPTADAKISLEAQLYIFDSQGQLVKEYKEKDFFIQTAGLYYGHNPTKKVAKKYSNLYASFFEIANLQEDKINKKLLKSGPITKENEDVAKANIEAFFNGRKVSYAKVFEYTKQSHEIPERNVQNLTPLEVIILLSRTGPYETYYTAPQIETKKYKKPSSTSFDLTKLNGGLEAGTYYCTINNLRMKIALLFISLLDGDETVMGGTYRVSGNKLIASFYNGDTRTYIIEDSKNFHLEGTNEYWVHESVH